MKTLSFIRPVRVPRPATRSLLALFLAPLLLVSAPRPARAWDADGHELVAAIASFHLTPAARAAVADILGDRLLTDLEVASWPDLVRNDKDIAAQYPGNARWHFAQFDVTRRYPSFTPVPDPDGNDVVGQIPRWHAVLADRSLPPADRLDALRFVVHLVGDIHQPLHCAYRYGDMGANMLPVNSFAGRSCSFDADLLSNLHSVWDSALVAEIVAGHTLQATARALDADISPRELSHWPATTPLSWATESYWIARKTAYRFADGSNVPFAWTRPGMDLTPDNYIDTRLPVVRERLQKAGVRLAFLLNTALDPAFADVEALPDPTPTATPVVPSPPRKPVKGPIGKTSG